jgi:hypothetical protein
MLVLCGLPSAAVVYLSGSAMLYGYDAQARERSGLLQFFWRQPRILTWLSLGVVKCLALVAPGRSASA